MIYRLLRLISFACCLIVVASFALFADDQLGKASTHQQQQLLSPASQAAVAKGKPRTVAHHGQPREFIDGAAGKLTAPMRSLISSKNAWVLHFWELGSALLVYGLGLGFLARFTSGRRVAKMMVLGPVP